MIEAGNIVPKARVGVDVAVPIHIKHTNAFAMSQYNRPIGVERAHVSESVKDIGHVSLFPR